VVDSTKVVPVLGRFPLPVEVVKMALPLVERRLSDLELRPKLRHHADGSLYLTDEDNYILDCACGMITEPEETAAEIRGIVGVVEHGLFLGMASLALVAGEDGVTELTE
jgi:ribose 5-phosphate isomerase A